MDRSSTPMVVVASYGGSGSTFLFELIKNARPDTAVFHTHSSPSHGFLGVPIFNRATGHAEGPFSRQVEMPRDARVVVIYRDPASAYQSRACYKHFMHLWSDTDRVEDLFGANPGQETFLAAWREAEAAGEDLFGFLEYLHRWRAYARQGKHGIFFVKYEKLAESADALCDFLGLGAAEKEALRGFAPRSREVRPKLKAIFAEADEELAAWPDAEVFAADPQAAVASLAQDPVKLEGSAFSVTGLNAGASDSFQRMALAYESVRSVFDIPFVVPDYSNYHSPELDFLDIFGISGNPDFLPNEARAAMDVERMGIADFAFFALLDRGRFRENTLYEISADMYESEFRGKTYPFRAVFNRGDRFIPHLSYTPGGQVFSQEDSVKAVLHLRRSDICGIALFGGLSEEEVPPRLRKGIQGRPLLSKARAVQELEQRLPEGTRVELVVATDGVKMLRNRFTDFPEVMSRLDALDAELETPAVSGKLDIVREEIMMGKGPEVTMKTLDAMSASDWVVTASSSFPNLICQICDVRLVHVRLDAEGARA